MIQVQSFAFNPFAENTYILYDETKEAIIIDAGCYSAQEQQTLTSFIDKNDLKVINLVNTHCHIDHVLGINFLKEKYKIRLKAHELEMFNFSEIALSMAKMWGFSNYNGCVIDDFISEKDTIKFGNSELEIRFTPGHSPGHVVFINQAEKICINGDVLFQGSIGRTDLPGGNHEQLIQSIKKQLFSLPDDVKVFTGHGPSTTIGFEKKHNPFF